MKHSDKVTIQLEELHLEADNSSFKIMVNPRMSDFFFWHFHPELELIYIEAASGTRHVGTHISRYTHRDLVLIGSNIPHLNFDYSLKTEYEKIVLHLRPDFLGDALGHVPELSKIRQLFEQSRHGICFDPKTQQQVGQRLKNLSAMSHFEQFLEILGILELLANSPTKSLLHHKPVENQYNKREQARLKRIYEFIDDNYQRKITIDEIADISNLTNAAFCRYFKKMTRLTFTEFMNHYRINQAQKMLLLDKNSGETCFECGFESLSYFNRTFKKITDENPLAFKKRYLK